jgi:hypothetical protein
MSQLGHDLRGTYNLPATENRLNSPFFRDQKYNIQSSTPADTEWTRSPTLATIRGMGRYRFPAFNTAITPRYVVVWDLQWHILECQRLGSAADLSGAMVATIERLAGEGWQAESGAEYGFTFIRRETERRLLALTPRDPYDTAPKSFLRFRS